MRQLNTSIVYAGVILIIQTLLLQACSTDVGGNEDRTASVVTINAITDADDSDGEIIGEAIIQWTSDEPNPSTVDIFLSNDSGETFGTTIALNAPDTNAYVWDTNSVPDCRSCRLRIMATDVVGNVGEPTDSIADFIINNVPQVLGTAYYTDVNNDGPGNGDMIRVPLDKDVELLTAIARDIFILPVLGDSIGPFATVSKSDKPKELIIRFNDIVGSDFHLHISGIFDANKLNLTMPSGLNLLDNIAEGVLIAKDTGRTGAPTANSIDIEPTFFHNGINAAHVLGQSNTTAVVLGDIDNDGDLDLITGRSETLNTSSKIWLNDTKHTDGTTGVAGDFVDSGQTLDPNLTQSMALGDIDKDGDLDLVTGNGDDRIGQSNIVWINDTNHPDGTTGVPGEFNNVLALGDSRTHSIALADVNNDTFLDIVAGNNGANKIWINNGSGSFMDGQAFGTSRTESIVACDVNNDDFVDIVAGNGDAFTSEGTKIWLNDGSGFYNEVRTLEASRTLSVVVADIDDDDDVDILEGNNGANKIWINNGSGLYTAGQLLGNRNTQSLAIADVDDDGDLDLIAGNSGFVEGIKVWLNDSTGIFTDSGDEHEAHVPLSIAVGDIDDDGDIDFVAGNDNEPSRVWVNSLKYPGDLFIDSQQIFKHGGSSSLALGDVDVDGDLDLFSGGGDDNMWLNDTKHPDGTIGLAGAFIGSGQVLGSNFIPDAVFKDVDGDDDLDLVVGEQVFFNNDQSNPGAGVFTDSDQILGSGFSISMVMGDIDGENGPDLVLSYFESDQSQAWLNNGSGFFTPGQRISSFATVPKSMVLGDINGDKHLDLIISDEHTRSTVYLNDGVGVFSATSQNVGSETLYHVLDDLDGDEDLDLITVGFQPGLNARVMINNINNVAGQEGIFTDSGQIHSVGFARYPVALGDVDNDGDPDLVISGPVQGNRVLINNGKGTFFDFGQIVGDSAAIRMVLDDIDGDGDIDLVTGNIDENRVWLNDY